MSNKYSYCYSNYSYNITGKYELNGGQENFYDDELKV